MGLVKYALSHKAGEVEPELLAAALGHRATTVRLGLDWLIARGKLTIHAEEENLLQVSDEGALIPVVEQVIQENPKQVQIYLNGKEGLIGYFIGQVMRRFEGSPDPKLVRTLLQQRLDALRN